MPNTYNRQGVVNTAPEATYTENQNSEDMQEPILNLVDASEEKALDADAARELICPTCDVMAQADDLRLRTLAEMDNYKKRLQRDKEEQVKYAAENILADIIPSLDNLDLAMQYAQNEACKDILMGVQMTRKLLIDSLKNHGLVLIEDVNVPFDPEVHEAMGQEPSDTLPEKHIVKLLQKGYKLKERLLRPAKVIIS